MFPGASPEIYILVRRPKSYFVVRPGMPGPVGIYGKTPVVDDKFHHFSPLQRLDETPFLGRLSCLPSLGFFCRWVERRPKKTWVHQPNVLKKLLMEPYILRHFCRWLSDFPFRIAEIAWIAMDAKLGGGQLPMEVGYANTERLINPTKLHRVMNKSYLVHLSKDFDSRWQY